MDTYHRDFLTLLHETGYTFGMPPGLQPELPLRKDLSLTEGTTILSIQYRDGVIIAGDRRATAGTSIMYDRAEKVLTIDDYSILAISGSPGIAMEVARILEHSFQHYRRSQLQELSLDGKLRTLSRLLKENLSMALQGIGAVLPIFASFDRDAGQGKLFFYDVLGAQFESTDFATSGSGSVWVRGALSYLNRWGEKRFTDMNDEEAVGIILRLLDTAAEHDAATSGTDSRANRFPSIKTVTGEGIREMTQQQIQTLYLQYVEAGHVR
ncbi:MAG: proteasome subunit alpha [Candidatus Latescibacteria bacterium]|nr:proteasome subunit alpha [Candidatus Latescibacterota bacterium]